MSGSAISLNNISKYYKYYDHEIDRVKEILTGKPRFRQSYALQDISLEVAPGEVLGIVGKNGAGKSTLLKILAGTLQASSGELAIEGRVAALLELGTSFHPEMTGHENIYLNCAIMGLIKAEIDSIYDDILNFSGIEEFIHRPVKTYSSGMFVRLAFAIATQIDPDILIIDEALSVGDGAFARKSFDRIMDFKRAGKTILFCTHSLYQIEAICDRVLWLEKGKMRALGQPAAVITDYGESLRSETPRQEALTNGSVTGSGPDSGPGQDKDAQPASATPRILDVQVRANGRLARSHHIISGETDLEVTILFSISDSLPLPSVGIAVTGGDGRILASVGTVNDGIETARDDKGNGLATVLFPGFPLLKGNYNLDVYLMCEKGLHIYESVVQAAELNVEQKGLARGLVALPHQWLQ